LNPTDLNNCTASTLTTRPAGDYDEPCIPELLYPEKLVEKGDPAWGLCGGPEIYLNGGAYDPPRVLTPTDALVLSPTKKPGAMPAFPAGPSLAPSTSPLSTPPPLTSTDPAGQADPGSHDKDPSNRGGDPKVPGSSKSPGPQNQVAGPSRNPKSGPITASGISGTYSTPSVQDPSSQGPNKGPKEDPKQDPNQSSGSQASNNQEQNPQRPDNGYGISSQTKGDSAGSKSHESGGNQGPTESSDANEPSPEANSQGDSKEPFDPASPAVGPLPTITYAGSAITPGPSSKYSLPGIGLLSPGGPDLTTNDLVYSLAPSATAILKNGQAVHLAPQPNQTAILTFASSIYTPNDVSHFVIGGQTVTPGGIITPKGTSISLNPSGRIAFSGPISSQQTLVTPVPAPPIARITFGSSTFTANPFGDFFIAGQMLSQGGLITVSGTPISLPPDGTSAIVGSVTQLLYPTPTLEPPFITFNGATYTADLAGNFLINGQTLNPGSAITASGTPISLSPDGTVAVIRSNSQILTTAPHATGKPILTFDGITYTANNADSFIIDGQTLRPGSAITVSGTPIPLPPGATVAIIGTSSQVLDPSLYTPALPIVTLQGSTYTANSSSAFHIDGQTLSKSGEITIQGTTLSYNVDGSNVVIGTSTQTLSTATPSNGDTITFAGQTYVANAASAFVIAGQTLTPGGVVTVSGTPISFAANGTDVVIGTSTEAVGLGSFIMGGFGPAQTAPAVFEGRAAKRNLEGMMGVGCAVGILVACWI